LALEAEFGDAVVVGCNGMQQLWETLSWLYRGPLPNEICEQIDVLWVAVKDEAPLDVFHG